ncbi:MAG: hypothetical protein AAF184_19970 [Pseudomonadota bacterium]
MSTTADQTPTQALLHKITRIFVSLLPWGGALFLHYWLEYKEIWAVDMAFRPAISAAILATGLALSFLVHSRLSRPSR